MATISAVLVIGQPMLASTPVKNSSIFVEQNILWHTFALAFGVMSKMLEFSQKCYLHNFYIILSPTLSLPVSISVVTERLFLSRCGVLSLHMHVVGQ